MQDLVRQIIEAIGEDPHREGLLDTPKRVAKAMKEITIGYHQNIEKLINGAIFEAESDEIIIVKDIELYSLCEHHMLPFFGKAHVGYIPSNKIIGLSKIPRIVDMYAKRLQIQERLTKQIADCLCTQLNPRGVMVVLEARHMCGMMRGVEKQNSSMVTSCCLGEFKSDSAARAEFLNLIGRQ
jgi:GTP cyclohydrolase IA